MHLAELEERPYRGDFVFDLEKKLSVKKQINLQVLFHRRPQNVRTSSVLYALLLFWCWCPALSGTLASAQAAEQPNSLRNSLNLPHKVARFNPG